MIGLAPPEGRLDILCVGAHPDDIEIGCGGTLLGLEGRPGTTVAGLVLTGTAERRQEAEAALPRFFPGATRARAGPPGRAPARALGRREGRARGGGRGCRPTVVMAPETDDAHQDHRLARGAREHGLARCADPPLRDPQVGRGLPLADVYVRLTDGQRVARSNCSNRCFPSQARREWWDDEIFSG